LFLFLTLAFAATALIGIGAAGAKPPAAPKPTKSPKLPPPGTPGVAETGKPGTITVTHYAADGTTVLGVERFKATPSDSSASVAAKLGQIAPDVVKTGTVTDWDDAGRPDAPLAQVESAAGTRTTQSAKRTVRRSDCCSSSGCDAVDVTRDISGDVFGDTIGTFHHRVYWCWSYPKITGVNVDCWSDVNGGYINDHGCDGWGDYYRWSGSDHGGHVSFRQGDWENCVYWFGCFKNIYPWIEIWVNGNGAWAQDQGG
jgi:hypothetical protein